MITQLNLETFKEIYHGNLIFGHHFDYSLVNISEYFKNKLREPHIHDFYEVLFLWEGKGEIHVDSRKYSLEAPCIFLLSPGRVHSYDDFSHCKGTFVGFPADLLRDEITYSLIIPLFHESLENYFPLSKERYGDFHLLISKFLEEIQYRNEKHNELAITGMLELTLIKIARIALVDVESKPGASVILAKNFLILVQKEFRNNLSVDFYAQKLGVSPGYLSDTLKKCLGRGAQAIIKENILRES